MRNFDNEVTRLLDDMLGIIYPILQEMGSFNKKLNYSDCSVQILDDDHSTLWVKWRKHDCPFEDLNIIAMATIANQIQQYYEEAKEDGLKEW